MPRATPPFNSLRVFEAVARHLSFRRAAGELHVTPGAVSQQIHLLEEYLGIALFERLPRAIKLTPRGQQYLPAITQSLQLIVEATARLRSDREVIEVSIAPSLCTRWLIPRLGRFCEEFPHYEVRIDAASRLIDIRDGSFDLAIRYTAHKDQGLHYEQLFTDDAFPVCSLAMANELRGNPRKLAQTKLLHWSTHDQWQKWFHAAGLRTLDRSKSLFFSHLMLALDAAIAGQGVALSSMPLVRFDLEAGRLVKPFGPVVSTGYGYFVVTREGALRAPKVRAFVDWISFESRAAR